MIGRHFESLESLPTATPADTSNDTLNPGRILSLQNVCIDTIILLVPIWL